MANTKPASKLCFAVKICWEIELRQVGPDNFTVKYGSQRKVRLTYNNAATELGSCIMHALACDDRLDNSSKEDL